MKIGVISDVHSNVVALDVVLQRLSELSRAQIICCGDVIGIDPRPDETVYRLMALPRLVCLRGNHDWYFADGISRPLPDGMSAGEAAHHSWEHARISAEAGALGCPGRAGDIAQAGALSVEGGLVGYELLYVRYDVQRVIEDIRRFDYPDCDNILRFFYGIKATAYINVPPVAAPRNPVRIMGFLRGWSLKPPEAVAPVTP